MLGQGPSLFQHLKMLFYFLTIGQFHIITHQQEQSNAYCALDEFKGYRYLQYRTITLKSFTLHIISNQSPLECPIGGRNSSVGSAWARCPQCHGFDPALGTFSGGGDFSLGVNMGSNSIPPKTPSDESINRGLVCARMHFIARTQKILTFMS